MCRFLPFFILLAVRLCAQTNLLPSNGIQGMQLFRPSSSYATMDLVPVTGQTFTKSVRVRTLLLPANPWDIQLNSGTTAPVANGDVLAGEIWLRRSDTVDPLVEIVFEQATTPYSQSFTRILSPTGTNWTKFRFAFLASGTYAAHAAQVNLRLGYRVQAIDLGGLSLTNYGHAQPLSAYPNDFTYPGRGLDAPWRAAALARIEQIRKTDLGIAVVDQDGKPIRHAQVELRMLRHEFGFGSAVDAGTLLGAGSDNDHYRAIITNWFNKAVLENDLKWPQWEGNPALAKNALRWFSQRGIPVRGHNLIWPGTNQPYFLPADVLNLLGDTNRLRRRIDAHFTNLLSAVRGQCVEWDVINEATHLLPIRNILGDGEMTHWFQLAQALDPNAVLFFNEYENLETAPGNPAPREKLYNVVRYLQTNGAPIQGVGLQSHFGGYLTPPDVLKTYLDHYAELGLILEATEFDISTTDEAVQADYLRDFLTLCFSHPSVNGILNWGFWEKRHWIPAAALIRSDWSLKPNGVAWTNLVLGEWWTTTNAVADSSGLVSSRAFKGDYLVTVRAGGISVTNKFPALGSQTHPVTVSLPAPVLQVTTQGTQVSLTWDSQRTGFIVTRSPTLHPASWEPKGTAIDDGTRWNLVLTPGNKTEFYRLERQ